MNRTEQITPDFLGNEIKEKEKEQLEIEKKKYDVNMGIVDNIGKKNQTEEDKKFASAISIFVDKINLAEQFIALMPTYYDKSGLWWVWNFKETRYELQDDIEILNRINNASGVNTTSSREKTEIINALKQVCRKNEPEKMKDSWIQFKNEIIDYKTGERFKATPRYFATNPIPYDLGSKNETPIMDKIFKEWVGEDYVQTLYEILAYCLIPDYPLHRIFWLVGSGLNGKGCFLRILRKFVGEQNVTSTELDLLLKSRFEKTRLYKKLVCQMGETNFNQMEKTSTLKQLTGQDSIGYEYKNKTPFTDINYAKIIIATNNLPTTTDKTIGFYRRHLIIDFPNQFTEKKDILAEIPEEEYRNLATKCVAVLMDLLKEREFHKEGDIEERIKRYEDRSDPLQKFINEFTMEDCDGHVWKNDFSKKLEGWCIEKGFRRLAVNTIGKKMKELGYIQRQISADWETKEGTKQRFRAWVGLKWKE